MALTIIGDNLPLSKMQRARESEILKNASTMEAVDQIQMQSLNNAEALATLYEDIMERNLKVDEVLATIYEAVLGGK